MPNKDGTGPNGQGPKIGRGVGNCKNVLEKDELEEELLEKENTNCINQNVGQGQGQGFGRGQGQGFGRGQGRRCCGK